MTDSENKASDKLVSEAVEGVEEKVVKVEKNGVTWEYRYKAMTLPQYNKTFLVLERINLNFRTSSKKPVWLPVEEFELHVENLNSIYSQLEKSSEKGEEPEE